MHKKSEISYLLVQEKDSEPKFDTLGFLASLEKAGRKETGVDFSF